ncbi:unnamed protein product [Adineta steineri]|uniref:J domain-containing protein n=2 Tax=Adineta steineri TaxID=433720 RepID=A0A815R4N2_9BILA|nr:unnamed protein product [Adineta steineri]
MASVDKSPYEILDVPQDINYVKLRGVYRTKIHEHKQKKISAINFRRICRAYETLSDFDKRKRYDSQKEWISELSIENYTPQQLAAEPDLLRDLKQRLRTANLTQLNAQDPVTGHTTLYTAARSGNLAAVKFLTEQGAEPDLSQRTKSTALHVAAFYGHADVVRCLLESGADYRIENSGKSTAEDEAYNQDVKQVFSELKQNAYVRVSANELDWFLQNGLTQHQDTEYFAQRQTLLHCASKKGYDDLVHWLIEQKLANLDLVDFNGNSALHLAAYGSHTSIVEYLLNSGCDSTLKNRWGTTAEEEGSKHGNRIIDIFKRIRAYDMFKMAIEGKDWWFYYYFDEKSKDMTDANGTSLLYHACRHGQHSVAKWLLEHGADVNIKTTAKPKSTPLHVAKFRGHIAIVELLLEYEADVNIKNDFGATVFDEDISAEVEKNIASKIIELLAKYKSSLKSDKLIEIHIYEDDGIEQEPIGKVKVGLKDGYKDLLSSLSKISLDQYRHFSIARRALHFQDDNTTIISAVGCARYTSSKFIDTPIRLIGHKTLSTQTTRQEPKSDLRSFIKLLDAHSKVEQFSLKAPLKQKQIISIDDLMFTFAENCITDDTDVKVTIIFSPDREKFDIPGCICLFKVDLYSDTPKLVELPVVSIVNQPNARLYTLATPSTYWFTSDTRRTRLSTLSGTHAFIHHVDIIPGKLALPIDMFIATALEQPLISRDNPVPCKCMNIHKRDAKSFPHVVYHGTNIEVIRSILLDGFVIPGTVVSSGKRINPPKNHIARDVPAFGVADFSAAIFVSPSIYYSSDSTYAIPFVSGDQQLIPLLECSVKSNSYGTYRCTTPHYKEKPGDNMQAIEWRITDPANIQINSILFITQIESIAASKMARITKMN